MEQAIIQRVIYLIKEKTNSERAFAIKIGIKQTTLNNQILGKRSISLDVVTAILTTFTDISAEWLLTGVGSMLKEEPTLNKNTIKETENEEMALLRKDYDSLQKKYANALEEIIKLQKQLRNEEE